jgi:hypothetical protein
VAGDVGPGLQEGAGGDLPIEDIFDGAFDLGTVTAFAGLMAASQHRHHAQAGHTGLAVGGRRKRSVGLLVLGEKSNSTVNGAIESPPLFGSQISLLRNGHSRSESGRRGGLLRDRNARRGEDRDDHRQAEGRERDSL